MAPKTPKLPETYSQIVEFLENVKKDADINTQLLLIQQALENSYVQKDQITKMIWSAISANQKSLEKNRINWTAIIQTVITAIIVAIGTAVIIKGLAL